MKPFLILLCVAGVLTTAGCENQALVRKYDGPHIEKPYIYGDRYVTVDGVRLCYTTRGSGPAVIFLRGVGGSVDYWDETLPHFEKDFTVYALDLPGFGKSDKPDVDYSVPFHTRMVLGFMDRAGITRASFVANSFGGHIAMKMAIDHPERVDRLALLATTGGWKPPNPLLSLGIQLFFDDEYFYRYKVKDWYNLWGELVQYETPNSEQKLTEWIRRRHAPDFHALCRAYTRSIKGLVYGTLRDDVDRITAPTLLLWGDDDCRHPVRDAEFLRDHMSDARLVVFKGGRQMIPWDFKDDFNREVMDFLKSPAAVAGRDKTIFQTNHISSRIY